jgi:Caspase domain
VSRSRCASIALACLGGLSFAAVPAAAEPLRILVAASHVRGGDGEEPLRHSTEDADQVREVLASLGDFASSATFRLVDPTASALRDALDRARALAATHAPADVTFVLYFSGHGDRDALRLAGETISMSEISDRVQAIPAALRVLVTDACRTDPTRPKGVSAEPGFALSQVSAPATGVVWLFASDTGEAAQESDELRGGLFTHYWVSGLRGAADANGDGRVTLAESYDFAFSQTLFRSARSSGVLQHPTATFALREAAPVVLTHTFGPSTKIELPPEADAHYLVYAVGSRSVLGEIWSNPERRAVFAVPPGEYVVQRRTGSGASAVADIAVGAGQDRALAGADFRAMPEEQLAGKGGRVVVRPNEVNLALGADVSRLTDVAVVGRLTYARAFGPWALGVGVHGSSGVQDSAANHVDVSTGGVEASAELRWPLGPATMAALGAGAAADVLHQHVQRDDMANATPPLQTAADYTAFAAGPFAFARLRKRIGMGAWLEVSLRGEGLLSQLDGALDVVWAASAALGGGVSF